MHQDVIKHIGIRGEDINNLKDCLERTKHMWEPFTDLWPFTITGIIEQWEAKED